ncbi:MAG TPA: DNA polymerase III subunit delta [Burkholderiales bacterium]
MAGLRLEQLTAHLAREIRPLYAIHGDEPLLALEAADAIRARARASGFLDRVVLTADRGFDWGELRANGASRSLFGDKKLIELRLASGKPGGDGAEAIEAFCRRLPPDTLTLVTLPRLDKAGQSSSWFKAIESLGLVVNVYPVERTKLPEWIAARLAGQKQRASVETLQFLADCVEGNLLAAHQEIQKLALLLPAGELEFDAVRESVLNVARYDALKLTEAMLGGERPRLARMLEGLRGEGEAPPRILWILAEEIRAIARVQDGLAAGRQLADVCREARVWGETRQSLIGRAARRLPRAVLLAALEHAAKIDRIVKGIVKGDPWDELLQLGLGLADSA